MTTSAHANSLAPTAFAQLPVNLRSMRRPSTPSAWRWRTRCERRRQKPRVILGRDTRESSPWIATTLAAGLHEAGAKVESAGVITTPAVAFLARRHGFQAGVVISASHNPWQDNGIKLFGGDGFKLPDAEELVIEDEILHHAGAVSRPFHEGKLDPKSCPLWKIIQISSTITFSFCSIACLDCLWPDCAWLPIAPTAQPPRLRQNWCGGSSGEAGRSAADECGTRWAQYQPELRGSASRNWWRVPPRSVAPHWA